MNGTEVDQIIQDIEMFPIRVISGPPVSLNPALARHLHDLGYRKQHP